MRTSEPEKTEESIVERRSRGSTGPPLRRINRLAARISLPSGALLRPDAGALAIPDFRRFWYSMLASNVGSWMQMVAQGWLILQLTDSPFYLGLVGLVRAIPALSITLIGGVLADRLDRRRVLLVTQIIAGVLAFTMAFLDLSGLITVWHVLIIAFMTSAVMAVDNPARQAMVPDLVGRENIASAIGLNAAGWNGAAVVGPSIAGVIVAAVGTGGAFLLNAVSFIGVVWAIWRITPPPQRPRNNETILENLSAGLRFISADRRIWGLMVIMAVATFLGRPFLQLMPVFARDVLQTGPSGYGVLMAVTGFGSLVGALTIGGFAKSSRKGSLLLGITLVFGISLLLFAGSRWLVPSMFVLLFVGATQTLFMALTNTLLQVIVPEEMRGRVMSAYVLIPMGLMPLGSAFLGAIGEGIGVPLTVGIAAAIVIAATAFSYRAFPEVRSMR